MFVRSFKAQKQHVRHLQLFAAKPHAFLSPALYAHTKKALFRTNSVRMMSGSTPDESKAVEKKPRKGKGGKAAEEPPSQTIEEIRLVRQQKMEAFRAEGTNPFAYTFDVSHSSSQLHDLYKDLGNGLEDTSAHVSIAGRVILRRVFGKLAFFTLQDSVGTIQLYLDKNRLNNDFDRLRDLVDAGDIIGVQGTLKRTDKGELSVYVSNWSILTKSMTPLPDKYRGFTDVNKRYRARQLDLIANPEVRDVFRRRAHIISGIRHTLDSLGYLEVETPILQTQPGGAEAKPFETFHHALDTPMTLRIATELHLKRLVVGGFDRVYEIGRIFRNEGLSTRHNPEFTTIELYCAYADYTAMMSLAEDLITQLCVKLHKSTQITYQDTPIDLTAPWRRASMLELVQEKTQVDFYPFILAKDVDGAKAAAKALKGHPVFDPQHEISIPDVDKAETAGAVLNVLFECLVESSLIQPTFVTEHPIDISPLAKPHRSKEGLTERFELFIYGREHANAFSELTDPLDQRQRFEAQALKKLKGDEEACGVDEEFLAALETGLPPTAGMGIGIDRVVMLLTDAPAIRDVICFPTLRPEKKE